MKSIYQKVAGVVALVCLSGIGGTASAEVLNFDDLTNGPHFFTSPYHGLTFTKAGSNPPSGSWFWTDQPPPTVFRSPRTSVSTEADSTGQDTESQLISSATPFILNGAWFTSLDTGFNTDPNVLPFEPVNVAFCLYYSGGGGACTGFLNLGMANSPYQFLASGYGGLIDAFTVYGLQGYFAMDDVSITAVPEPAGYALVLAALSGLALSKQRSKR